MALDNFKFVKHREAEKESFKKGTKTSVKIHTKQKTTTVTTETTTKKPRSSRSSHLIEGTCFDHICLLGTGEIQEWEAGGGGDRVPMNSSSQALRPANTKATVGHHQHSKF